MKTMSNDFGELNLPEVDIKFKERWPRIETGFINEVVEYYCTGVHQTQLTLYFGKGLLSLNYFYNEVFL